MPVLSSPLVNVICMKWGTKYGPTDVNILRAMVHRHLSRPHRFVCFTDDAAGLDGGVEHFPLPIPHDLKGLPERGWTKLGMFMSPLADLTGPTLFVDLDVVIVDSIDCFFAHEPGEFILIRDWVRWNAGNSSVVRFEAGRHADLLKAFTDQADQHRSAHRNEQDYISWHQQREGPLHYWPREWCVSFKYDCLPRTPLNWFRPARLRPGMRIVVFHGNIKPVDAIRGGWSKLRRVKPVPWVAPHWRL